MTENKNKEFEEMLEIILNDLSNLDNNEDFVRMKNVYSNKIAIGDPSMKLLHEELKRVVTYPSIYKNFKGGVWDHKVKAKKVTTSYYHKSDKNAAGKPAAIFGTTMPGDDEYIYDHDFWGNISYGYMLKKMGLSDIEIEGAAIADDFRQSFGKEVIDFDDYKMVRLGMKLYDKYEAKGKMPSKNDLRNFIVTNKDDLRRHKKSVLADRRYRTKGGEDVDTIAKKYDLTADQLLEYNEKHKQGIKGLTKEQSLLPNVKPILPDPEERFKMQQTKVPEGVLEQKQENYNKILKAIEENNNPREDIIYKHPSQVPEDELKEAMKHAGYETKDPELKKVLEDQSQKWFDHYYGTEPVKRDASGRQMDSEPKYPYPQEVIEAKSKDNLPMSVAFKQVAEQASPFGVKALQKGLNDLYRDEYKKVQLKEDSVLGPKTTSRMKEALATLGVNEVNKSVRVGGFASMLEENRKRQIDRQSLSNTMSAIRPKDGGLFLQHGLNKLGAGLKEDNDIGPKTTDAFNRIKDEKENDLRSYVQDNMSKEIIRNQEIEDRKRQKEEERVERERERKREKERLREETERQAQMSGGLTTEGFIR